MTLTASFRPGAPTTPQLTPGWVYQFLNAEEASTATLMSFYKQARLELESFIRTGDLTVSDSVFYRQLLAEVEAQGTKLNEQGAQWTSDTIPEAYRSAWSLSSSNVIPARALEALSKNSLALIRDTTDMQRRAIRQAIATSILEGLQGDAIRSRILASGLHNIERWPSVEYRAGVIARTETMRAFNEGNVAAIQDAGARFCRWIASPDEAVCPICAPRNEQVYRFPGDPGAGVGIDPYGPAVATLPKLPAHPRCRCTVRAEFRGPNGEVISGLNPPEEPPTIPTGLMGGNQPAKPPTPSAAGDFDKALGDLNRSFGGERLTDWRRIRGALSQVTDAEQRRKLLGAFGHDEASWAELESKLGVSFWRNLGRIEEADIQKIARFGKTATNANTTLANFLEARYGIGFKAKPGWTPELRAATIRALERIRELNPSYVTDSIYLRLIGDRPYGAKNFKGGVIARAFASGEVEGNMKTWAEFTKPGATLRAGAGVDAAEEVIIHEYFHTIHSRFGLHDTDMVSRLGGGRINPFKAIEAVDRAWHEEYEAIRRQSHGIAPDEAAVTKLEERIRQYQGYVDDPTRQYARGYNEGIVTRYTRELQELRDALNGQVTHEWNPTEYAVRGGYAEDFAESGMLYMLNPARLKKYSPLRYEFFKQRVFGGQEAR